MLENALPHYADLLAGMIRFPSGFIAEREGAAAVQVERGILFPDALARDTFDAAPAERLIELGRSDQLDRIAIIDRNGHHRPAYRGLLIYAWLQALNASENPAWEAGLRPWCHALAKTLADAQWPAAALPAAQGAILTDWFWTALALHVAGKRFNQYRWTKLAGDAFARLARSQQSSGTFLKTTSSDNPETHWYHELVIAHAAASYAVMTGDQTLARCTLRNAEFHLNETQPDHATTQPWGLFAFAWNPSTRMLADQLLHAVHTQPPGSIGGVSLMLLADSLYCIRTLLSQENQNG